MLEYLKTMMDLLVPASVTVEDLQPQVGEIIKTYVSNVQLEPYDDHFALVDVVQQYQSKQVAHVDLTLTDPIALSDLEAEFGSYRIVVPDDKQPNQALFSIKLPEEACDITLIADLNRAGTATEAITLRRDVHS
jgi:hypothetical protein